MKRAALLLATISLFGLSCERHSWESTKVLHKHGGGEKHATDDHGQAAHGSGHATEDAGHAKPEAAPHGEPAKSGEGH